ncbi:MULTISPECIES: SDR family oxidoreductase [Halomicrobium]|uniref:NAD-dependent epimerase/dehydratase n=2 Tax=Halomicrobium mukohataei TaxID=57705 RepID=C7P1R5_HALMD|nr:MULTISPECIES: SDR family oxidoreductase [Halomicrobium]ACV49155.1 NAD-dependent epimerase/dehydratase [Halomicrobium mukohataei DSM 12286]QCD64564.1 SDR family oxidoreductase [Halomicrobium mukohataei]QFR19371.1 NAD(P)H-binding protein [Halomicrobium sp. ZPS1]
MRVAILGCGYVGLALCRQLTDAGHDVVGVRRSPDAAAAIEDAGGTAVRADVTDADDLAAVPDVDAVVFAASSGGRGADAARRVYVEGLQTVIDHFGARDDPPARLVYTSSTGVYGDHDGDWVDETTPLDPQTDKTRVLAEAERIARERALDRGIDGTVARFAGLYGPDRYRLERYLDGPVTEGYLNMVHRADAAGAVAFLLREGVARDETVLVVDDEPVSKWAFADWLADECGVAEPPKRTTAERLADDDLSETARRRIQTSKRCSNDRLHSLGYEFAHPTFRSGYRDAIERYRAAN